MSHADGIDNEIKEKVMMESWKKIEASSKEIAFILLPNSILSASL
jgi:hypothetical protein